MPEAPRPVVSGAGSGEARCTGSQAVSAVGLGVGVAPTGLLEAAETLRCWRRGRLPIQSAALCESCERMRKTEGLRLQDCAGGCNLT